MKTVCLKRGACLTLLSLALCWDAKSQSTNSNVIIWGRYGASPFWTQIYVPAGLTDAVELAVSSYQSIALRSDLTEP